MIEIKGMVWRMQAGAADLTEVTIKSAKLLDDGMCCVELKPEQAKLYAPGMTVSIRIEPSPR